jgi:acetyl esterase
MLADLGQFIDPKLNALIADSEKYYAARETSTEYDDLNTPEGLRKARSARKPSTEPLKRVKVIRVGVDGKKVEVRIIRPKQITARAVLMNIPGGGFYLPEAEWSDIQNAKLADSLGVVVISVNYRLAPEHPWPAAPNDCIAIAQWLIKQSIELFGTSKLILGGTSAGATLAMVTLLKLRDMNLSAPFVGSILQFGAYDLSGQTPGGRLYKDEYFIEAYVGTMADKTQPEISPLYADLVGLPPILIIVGTADILLEDNLAMAARLSAVHNEIDLRVYPNVPHGFTSHPTKMAAAAIDDIAAWTRACCRY